MIIFLGYLFLSLIISAILTSISYFLKGNFLDVFLANQLIPTLASLVGFNVAAVIFLLGQLDTIENSIKESNIFDDTRKEIKQNIYFVLIDFTIIFSLLAIRPSTAVLNINPIINTIIDVLIIALFLLTIFSIYEILKAVFKLNRK